MVLLTTKTYHLKLSQSGRVYENLLKSVRLVTNAESVQQAIAKALSLRINHLETAKGYGKSDKYVGAIVTGRLSYQFKIRRCINAGRNSSSNH